MRLEDITVADVRINGESQKEFIRLKSTVNEYMHKQVPGFVRNVRFCNVTIEGGAGEYLVQLQGADAQHSTRDVTLENVVIAGQPLAKDSPRVQIGANVENARIETHNP